MKFGPQKRLAASILKCSKKRIWFDEGRLADIKEAITKIDLRALVKKGAIGVKQIKGISRVRANKKKVQKRKGRQKGAGNRKGKATARLSTKKAWMNKVRLQRKFLAELKQKKLIEAKTYRDLYSKSKGGFFRSRRHLKLYITEHDLFIKNE